MIVTCIHTRLQVSHETGAELVYVQIDIDPNCEETEERQSSDHTFLISTWDWDDIDGSLRPYPCCILRIPSQTTNKYGFSMMCTTVIVPHLTSANPSSNVGGSTVRMMASCQA